MAGFYLPGAVGGQGLGIRLGDFNGDGKFDVDVGLRNFSAFGNGAYGGYDSQEIGFSSNRGLYTQGESGRYTPYAAQNQQWGADAFGSYSNNTYGDVFGNYQNHRYASNVFGGYSEGHTAANPWGFQNHEYAGNRWGGPQFESHSYGDAWGRVSVAGGERYRFDTFRCGGGPQVGGWFGGCF